MRIPKKSINFANMNKTEQIVFLRNHSSPTPSTWREEAEANRLAKIDGWLAYSRKIAIKAAIAMKQQNLSRTDVANRMNCSPQYVSRLLKGEENLSLETICKLENALHVPILQYEFA